MKGEVKERGMIFNDEMVRAILEGRKTQTRRIMKNQPAEVGPEAPVMVREIGAGFQWYGADGVSSVFNCPFGIVGDRIWVRETWAILGNEDGCSVDWNDNLCRGDEKNAARIYRASCEQKPGDYGLWSIVWLPFSIADAAKRRTFNINNFNRRTMVQGAGLVMPDWLKKQNRRKKSRSGKVRWNCPHCGKITWQYSPYDFEGCSDYNCEGWRE
ncbi:hypothetical protein [Escherichia coli]|uniref:hypothetical protein n=1 Tax=Escherichia coli TaxID=562 RepID=UPI00122E7969|nr:hypothetical protein [Escherichia coli]KAA2183365.1 hypothetical protein EA429_22645 [Escherichia coli]HAK9541006.1 hypothetical protein [Escherichia coli]